MRLQFRVSVSAGPLFVVSRWLRATGVVPADAATRLQALQQLGNFFNGGTALPVTFRSNLLPEPTVEGKKKDD
jgi:hypothetical protein